MPKHALPRGWEALRTALIAGAVILSPVFFAVMYVTVTTLLRPSFGWWAWTVPVGTEGCFVLLYGLDILLEWAGKPMGWLRWTPYPFAAASLILNVYASRGDLPGMLGHGAVTVAFFLPLIAGEAAVRSLSVSDDDMALRRERADARRYAIDLCRDRKGRAWRWRVPSLLRVQVLRSRFPATVAEAVADGARFGGASKWEAAVEQMVAKGLTRGDRMDAEVRREKRAIATAADTPESTPVPAPGSRQPARQKDATTAAAKRARAERLLRATPQMPLAEVAARSGVSERTASRIKSDLAARPLSAVR